MMKTALIIGLGGFLGSVSRYYSQQLASKLLPGTFPFGTFLVNIVGCLLIGITYAYLQKQRAVPAEWNLFLLVGFIGSYTTYSTFALEKVQLLQSGDYLTVSSYLILSVAIGLIATWAGIYLVR